MSTGREGRANSEFLLYMALLLVLGLLVFSLAAAGSSAYGKLIERKERDGRLRVAVSYLEVVVRKHDASGAIRLDASPFGPGQALFLLDEYGGDVYETVVFHHDGALREVMTLQGAERTVEMAAVVAVVPQVDFEREGSGFRIRAVAEDGTGLSSFVHVRTSGGDAP